MGMGINYYYTCTHTIGHSFSRSTARVLVGKGMAHPYQKSLCSSEHISVLACIRADGEVMPPMIIYTTSLPKTAYKEIGPEGALHKATESGYINTDLYLEYIRHLDSIIPGANLTMR